MEEKKEDSQETGVEESLTEETELGEIENEEEAEIKDEFFEEEIEETPPPREKETEEYVEERIYTIPLQRAWLLPANRRAPKAIRIVKAFVQRHMKVEEKVVDEEEGGRIIISNEVNQEIWSRGIEKPPRKLRIRAAKDEKGNVTIFLA